MTEPGGSRVGGTVLVVEDNPANMKLTKGLLGLLGCKVLEAASAETGLQILEAGDVDLVLLDIHLPGMDGISACRIIRQEMDRRDMPVIALSAMAMEEDLKNAIECGFDDYITKPIDTRKFLEMITAWLSGKGARQAKESAPAEARMSLKRVLVVDDSMANVKLIKSMLPAELYVVGEAYSGQQALDAIASSPPDVIFLDIMMPDMDGYEVTRRVKADPETAHIPIVLVTALDGLEDRLHGLTVGAEDVLVKPVNRVEVVARARSMARLSEYQKQINLREQAAGGVPVGAPRTSPGGSARVPSILLVEDNQKDAQLIVTHFGKGGYEVQVAEDGDQAVRQLEEKRFDVVLLDLLLPDMDGLEILARVKGTRHSDSTQVVVLTAVSDLDTRLKGIGQGADDFLVKPVHPRELQARIQVLLRKKAFIDSLRETARNAADSAARDQLTGLYHKAYLYRYLELEIKRSRRHRNPLSLVMVDVDDFKSYNTRFGHLVGDLVLREVASVLKNTFRDIDLVARFGGDEFVVVLPYCAARELDEVVQRACRAVSGHPFPTEGDLRPGSVSISAGMATFGAPIQTAEELIHKADVALLRVKQARSAGAAEPGGETRT